MTLIAYQILYHGYAHLLASLLDHSMTDGAEATGWMWTSILGGFSDSDHSVHQQSMSEVFRALSAVYCRNITIEVWYAEPVMITHHDVES